MDSSETRRGQVCWYKKELQNGEAANPLGTYTPFFGNPPGEKYNGIPSIRTWGLGISYLNKQSAIFFEWWADRWCLTVGYVWTMFCPGKWWKTQDGPWFLDYPLECAAKLFFEQGFSSLWCEVTVSDWCPFPSGLLRKEGANGTKYQAEDQVNR